MKCLAVVLGVAMMVSVWGCGDDQEFVVIAGCELRPGTACRNAQLQGQDLSGSDLSNGIFTGADFSDGNLRNVIFRGADLSGANLSNADLDGADFTNADLSGADLSGANTRNTRGLEGTCNPGCMDGLVCEMGSCVPPDDICAENRESCADRPCCGDLICFRDSGDICGEPITCVDDIECAPGETCVGVCRDIIACEFDLECPVDEVCIEGICRPM